MSKQYPLTHLSLMLYFASIHARGAYHALAFWNPSAETAVARSRAMRTGTKTTVFFESPRRRRGVRRQRQRQRQRQRLSGGTTCIYIYICIYIIYIYIYIERERERERYRYTCVYIHIYTPIRIFQHYLYNTRFLQKW